MQITGTTHTLLSSREAAHVADRSIRTIQSAVQVGKLKGCTIRGDLFIHPQDLSDYLKAESEAEAEAQAEDRAFRAANA